MAHPLSGPEQKFRRAQLHFQTLDRQIRQALDGDAYTLVRENADPEHGRYVFRAKVNRPIPADLIGLTLGDTVHNLRSALDHLAWQLSYSPRRTPRVPNLQDTATQWPIFRSKDGFRQRGKAQITHVAPVAGALIERMQPYHRAKPLLHPLWALRELDNTDKHRVIPVVAAVLQEAISRVPIKIAPGQALVTEFNTSAIEDGMELLRVELPEPHSKFEPDFRVQFDVKLGAGILPDDAIGVPYVRHILPIIFEQVSQTLTAFASAWDSEGIYDDDRLRGVDWVAFR